MKQLAGASSAETSFRVRPSLFLAVLSSTVLIVALAATPASADRSYLCQITAASTPSTSECNGSGNAVPGGAFTDPQGLTIDDSDNIWVTDMHPGGGVDKFDSSGNFIAQSTGAPWTGQFIQSLTFSRAGDQMAADRIFVADSALDDLWGLGLNASYAQTDLKNGLGGGCCYLLAAADNSSGTTAGDLYVSSSQGVIFRIDARGLPANFSAAEDPNPPSYITANQINGTPSGFFPQGVQNYIPSNIATDNDGNLYVAERSNRVVDKFDSTGTFVQAFTGADVPGGFSGNLSGVAIDPTNGNILVVSTGNNVVEELDSTGAYVGRLIGPSSSSHFGNLAGGIAVSSTGSVYVADNGHAVIDVFTPSAIIPRVSYRPVADPTPTSGTLEATVDPNGGEDITFCRLDYGPTLAYGSSIPCSPDPNSGPSGSNFSIPTEVSASISGLTTEATYHYRFVAGNANGTRSGSDQTFTPHAAVGLTTEPPSGIGPVSATLNGSFIGGGSDTHYYYQWGTTLSYGNNTASPPGADAGSPTGPDRTPLPVLISGLTPETTYHYRVVASNTIGMSIGDDQHFKTPPAVAALTTGPATNIVAGSATLTGSYTGDGNETAYYFQYGLTNSYGQTTAVPPGTEGGSTPGTQNVVATANGILPYLYYHYRIVATNVHGTSYGTDRVLFSSAPVLPTVDATFASSVEPISATLNAQIKPGFGTTIYRFEYGPTNSYKFRTYPNDLGAFDNVDHLATAEISSLIPRNTYHFRAVATNFAGTAYGPDQVFSTPDIPRVDTNGVSTISATAATLDASIHPGFRPTTYRFEYGLTAVYERSTPESAPVGADDSAHGVSEAVAGLLPGMGYHYRVVATNVIGTVSGPDSVFTTAPPAVTGPIAIRCRKRFIKRQGKCVRRLKRGHHNRGGRHG